MSKEVMKLALEALVQNYSDIIYDGAGAHRARAFESDIKTLIEALAQPAQTAAMPSEIALMEKVAKRVGITSLLNNGAASCVFSEGCNGVSQSHLLAYTREVALHCAVALAAPQPAQPPQQGEPAHDKKIAAMALLIKSLEAQLSYHRAQADKYREAVNSLESERAANSRLTAELRRLEAENEKFHERQIWWNEKMFQLEAENERLRRIEEAAANLIRVKGRYHTEQAFRALAETLKETP